MNDDLKRHCDKAFHEFLRSQPYEIAPDSPLFDVCKIAFEKGFSVGGQIGAERAAELIRKDLNGLLGG